MKGIGKARSERKAEIMATKKNAVETPAPSAAPAEVEPAETCPIYTLSGDTKFGVLGMIALARMAPEWGASREIVAELTAKVREFELWERRPRDSARD